jgi:hypothetical protein
MVLAQAEAAKAVPLGGIFASSPSPALKPGLPEKMMQARTGLPASKGQPFNVISSDTPFLNGLRGRIEEVVPRAASWLGASPLPRYLHRPPLIRPFALALPSLPFGGKFPPNLGAHNRMWNIL